MSRPVSHRETVFKNTLSSRFAGVMAHCLAHGFYTPTPSFIHVCKEMNVRGWLIEIDGRWYLTDVGRRHGIQDATTQFLMTSRYYVKKYDGYF